MWINIAGVVVLLLLLELLYFFLAKKYNIIDKPNSRSSHQYITIRGGGIIFPIAALVFLPYALMANLVFGFALLVIASLSFLDDIKPIDSSTRLFVQSITVAALLYALDISLHWLWLPVLFIVITGVLNAYNFMDGINGITVLYSMVTMVSLFWVSREIQYLQPDLFFVSVIAGLCVFGFFNLRKRAVCFAGDVGSVSMAFVICFLLLSLILQTGFVYWLFFLAIYGIDAVFTLVSRILRKEPLMQAHRSHFYQFLANEKNMGHISISTFYALSQLVFNLILIYSYIYELSWLPLLTLFVFLTIYTIFRLRLEGRKRLFVSYNPE